MTTRTLRILVPFALALFPLAACKKESAAGPAPKAPPSTDSPHVAISVTEKGFEPDKVNVKKDVMTTFVFTRKTDKTCAKEVVFEIDPDHKVRKDLPLNTPVEVAVKFPKAGEIRYACGMDMVSGVFTVQ